MSSPDCNTILKASLVSLLGLYFHNWWDLPHIGFLTPEYLGPTAGYFVIFGAWWIKPDSKLTLALVWIWTAAHLIGGGLISVLPLEFLPYYPEQSLSHYAGHVVYAATQAPLLFFLLKKP